MRASDLAEWQSVDKSGHDDLDTFIEFADDVHLDGVGEHFTVPFLVAHGANNRQIPRPGTAAELSSPSG